MGRYPSTLRKGSTGEDVGWLQTLLYEHGVAMTVDKRFGEHTEEQVRRFQDSRGLVPDGVVGPHTWGALLPPFTYFRQGDPRWGALPYTVTGDPRQTIRSSGCGPTCAAMVAAQLAGAPVDPPRMCALACAQGFRTKDDGTAHALFPWVAKRYALSCRCTQKPLEALAELDGGALVVANMGPGYFTSAGHFIVLWAYNPFSDAVYVLDPGNAAKTKCDADLLAHEGKAYFCFRKEAR